MDPDKALEELRELADQASKGSDNAVWAMVQKFDDLDEWLSNGGFAPKAWRRRSRPDEPDPTPVELARQNPAIGRLGRMHAVDDALGQVDSHGGTP
ncbi:hypothetical protein SEA_PUPPER_57 [Gordonia phage Pupper]|uniref:Uncharacterized protein n=1 Tax=Gordonia phage Pupper TaxID=2571249 RepID=A0A4Y6EIJ6_9CAUD|nr:HNH endonuclease [Gordonia phage Pupper]QDF18543.1 hypothetical protein SEA_PUPPER_57 [Gordonia phage Pupper]QDF18776.1 hypothetical protein SEA_SCENTAE_57 [Gordonia phage SCentae]